MAGTRTGNHKLATVAGPEPEIAPKKQATITHTNGNTASSVSHTGIYEFNKTFGNSGFAMIFPESTKNGMARSKNLLIPAYILVATMVKGGSGVQDGTYRGKAPGRLQWARP